MPIFDRTMKWDSQPFAKGWDFLLGIQFAQDRSENIRNKESNPVDSSRHPQEHLAQTTHVSTSVGIICVAFLFPQFRRDVVGINKTQGDQNTRYGECPAFVPRKGD